MNEAANLTAYASGFNQGLQDGSQRFSTIIQVLAFTFLLKVVVRFPKVANYLEEKSDHDLVEIITYSSDVLAFFLTAVIYWALQGNAVIK